jgi:hypothetical protein
MSNPYTGLPDYHFWRRAVAGVEPFLVDPVVEPRFRIGGHDRVATAGSCFAQHIARRLSDCGLNYFVTEAGEHLPADERSGAGYRVFSARFGNIYTTRQLLQLFEECFDGRQAVDSAWKGGDGRWVDALRPQVQPGGYASVAEVAADRVRHLDAVRRMFAQCDFFVFTLGLTEAWQSKVDGTVFPLAPGVAGGEFDPERHEFVNFGIREVTADLSTFLERLRALNPPVRVVLTVSPVPLIATYEPRHVLVSNTASKSTLRVAAEDAWRRFDWVDYFPSYEIITGNFNDSAYYEPDYRGVNPQGVDHAMRCFMRHYTGEGGATSSRGGGGAVVSVGALEGVVCDEEAIDPYTGEPSSGS